ncbi:MAG: DUF523 domain-containing protein [Thermodesulfobacteriota bacterium]
MSDRPVIVSACLLGIRSRYDGTDSLREELVSELRGTHVIPVCPEQLGGLPTPRPAAEITGGDGTDVLDGKARVVDEHGSDVTGAFVKGAEEVLKLTKLTGAKTAILKEKSPSCGVSVICGGGGVEARGAGVTTALLKKNGVDVRGVG